MGDIFDIFKKLEAGRAAQSSTPVTHLVVGLGNPGKQYVHTRHNAGFLCMDALCEKYGVSVDRAKFQALVGEATIGGSRVLLMKPQTFMNLSGVAVAEAARFYKIPTENIIVISDDINLPVGGMRVRGKGSDGGQRGIRSMIDELGSDAFARVRIGVGAKPHPNYDLADWVLSTFAPTELDAIKGLFPAAAEGIEWLIKGNLDRAMQVCNRKPQAKKE